jgi:hypothetical protein
MLIAVCVVCGEGFPPVGWVELAWNPCLHLGYSSVLKLHWGRLGTWWAAEGRRCSGRFMEHS